MAPKRVAIIGGGAAGMSAALAFSKHPSNFEVSLFERSATPGGMATSMAIDAAKFGADYINDGVQGASPIFHNTFGVFEMLGFKPSQVGFQVSFGKDEETEFWSNVFPSKVIEKHQKDIKKFGRVLKIIHAFEPIFALIPVERMLGLFRFDKEFGEVIVFPLVALFFGTGNQTPHVSSAILGRVFYDPSMRLFEYSSESFLASIPEMRAFPRLDALFMKWKEFVEKSGNVKIRNGSEVLRVKRTKKNVGIWWRSVKGTDENQKVVDPSSREEEEWFDEMIICTDADAALKILGKEATWMERKVLGNVKYLWDVTVTHCDLDYMRKYYQVEYDDKLATDDPEAEDKRKFAKENFLPLYFTRSYPEDKKKIEMSFDLTAYQGQFKGVPPTGPGDSSDKVPPPSQPLDRHVFQTIFLDNTDSSHLWSKGEIREDKVIGLKWWHQPGMRWQHYAGTVGFMGFINGKHHTRYAGSWTVLNMHEIAVVSGFGAAYTLGAEFPFTGNSECSRLFALTLFLNHMTRMRKEDRKGFFM